MDERQDGGLLSRAMIRMTWPEYQRQECRVSGFRIHLSPTEAEILLVMLMRYPRPTDILTLIEAVWPLPDDEPEAAYPAIYQRLHELRAKVGSFRIARSGHHGWFELIQEPTGRALYASG